MLWYGAVTPLCDRMQDAVRSGAHKEQRRSEAFLHYAYLNKGIVINYRKYINRHTGYFYYRNNKNNLYYFYYRNFIIEIIKIVCTSIS